MTTTPEQPEPDGKPPAQLKFLGMSSALDNPPEYGDTQTFTVTARCVGYGADERQAGGLIPFRKMRVLHVEPGEIEKAPPQAEQLQLGEPPELGEYDPDEDVDDEPDPPRGLATVSPFAPPTQP